MPGQQMLQNGCDEEIARAACEGADARVACPHSEFQRSCAHSVSGKNTVLIFAVCRSTLTLPVFESCSGSLLARRLFCHRVQAVCAVNSRRTCHHSAKRGQQLQMAVFSHLRYVCVEGRCHKAFADRHAPARSEDLCGAVKLVLVVGGLSSALAPTAPLRQQLRSSRELG